MIKRIKVKRPDSHEKECETIKYPSASLMLDISRNEYERERERSNMLDNKASLFISAALAILTIIIPIIPFSEFILFYKSETKIRIVVITIVLGLLFTSTILFVIAIYNLCKVITVKKYKNVNFENLNDDTILQSNENQTKRALVEHYNTILNYNLSINNEKAEQIKIGFKYGILSFAFLFISTISLLILMGE
mgnify:CR=1 FL=1